MLGRGAAAEMGAPPHPSHPHGHHTPVKKTPAATIRQDARQAALLNLRKTQREKVMAIKRVELLPPDVPPQPQPLAPLLLSLHDLLQQQQQQQEEHVLQQQQELLQQLSALMCSYPQLLDALAEQQEPASSAAAAAAADRGCAGAFQCDAYAVLTLVLQQNLPVYLQSISSGEQQLQQLLLRLLTDACACLAELALAAPVDEQTVQHVVPLLLQLIEQQQQQEEEGEEDMLRLRAAYALANVAATWPSTCAALGACKPALHLLQQAERQFAAACAAKQQQQQQQQGEGADKQCLSAVRLVTIAARLCGNLQRHIPDSGVAAAATPAAAAADASLLAARIAALEGMLKVELQQQQALLLLSSGDERRACVAEVLWCLNVEVRALLLFYQHEQQQQQQQQQQQHFSRQFCSAAAAAVGAECPNLALTLLRLIDMALQGSARAKNSHEQQQQQQQQQRDPDAFLRERLDKTGADGLVPALQCLAVLCDSRRVGLLWGSEILASHGPQLLSLLQHLLQTDDHRGVLHAALSVVTSLAAGPPSFQEAALALLPSVASILHSASSFDIRREAAEGVLHLAMNNEARHLDKVLAASPSVVDSLLDTLERSKYDLASVLICLDFFSGLLDKKPKMRAEIQAADGIAKLESVQFVHGEEIDKRVSWLVARYFDDLSEEEEEAADHPPPAGAGAAAAAPAGAGGGASNPFGLSA
ncbi:hypothetical protein Efla_007847 [Eimeria flavescens]